MKIFLNIIFIVRYTTIMSKITFAEFKADWLMQAAITPELASSAKGRQFALKLFMDYYDIMEEQDEFLYHLDGAGDGGIDIAFLKKGEADEDYEDQSPMDEISDTWYIVQSKYGSAYKGSKTLLEEADKIFNTLEGTNTNLSNYADSFLKHFNQSRQKNPNKDKVILVFATENEINESKTLDDIAQLGKVKFGNNFEVMPISIYALYAESPYFQGDKSIKLPLNAKLTNVNAQDNILVGAVRVTDLFDFLKKYHFKAGRDLDKIFNKNVRRFLKGTNVNKQLETTLKTEPQNFGLYNNGITIVVSHWHNTKNTPLDARTLVDPYIVNGCQTVKTIWNVLDKEEDPNWRTKYESTFIITKIAKVASENKQLLRNVIQYTNQQNAIKPQDFLALEDNIIQLKQDLETQHNVFLEVHRGELTALQKRNGANMFELIKVYGAGWMGKAGDAANKNPPFLPQGVIFKQIMAATEDVFGVNNMLAAYHIYKFAAKTEHKKVLKNAKFLFYGVVIRLLKPIIGSTDEQATYLMITQSLLALIAEKGAFESLMNHGLSVVEDYLNIAHEDSYINEPFADKTSVKSNQDRNLHVFMKNPKLFQKNHTPNLLNLIQSQRGIMKKDKTTERIKQILKEPFVFPVSEAIEPTVDLSTPLGYVEAVKALREFAEPKLTWKSICIKLGISPGNSARRALRVWIPLNHPDWPLPSEK